MADVPMPAEMIAWMQARNWGDHHDQWHFERRWDFWRAILAMPDLPPEDRQQVQSMVDDAIDRGWTRAPVQEGQAGNGEEFLFMHRAMFQLLVAEFPQHLHFLRGWHTPPLDPADAEDAVPPDPPGGPANSAKGPFSANMASAIPRIEAAIPGWATDDEFGLFLETNFRPTPSNALARSQDPQTGLHNYLHNRWSDESSPINIGSPRVNTFNWRFWKLHGWIDHQWWRFRRARGANDADPAYRSKLDAHIAMMNMVGHGGHTGVHPQAATRKAKPRTWNVFRFDTRR